jgi:ferredoxin
MAHHAFAYSKLVDRLNYFPQGAPKSELLTKILSILFSEREAELVSILPIKPFTAAQAQQIWKLDLVATQNVLDGLASKALLVDIEQNGETVYVLPPPMAGFFEFSMMRVREDIDQKLLSELFYQYMNVQEDFMRELILGSETQLGRVFVQEAALDNEMSLHVLDYERAGEVIKTASHIGISMCYCRHKMAHLDRACDAPMNICMTFNNSADSLIRHGHARRVDVSECTDLLQTAQAHNLVQFGENVRRKVNFICNCCGCCCEALLAIKRFGLVRPIHSNFVGRIDEDKCVGCGGCVDVCPVNAAGWAPTENTLPENPPLAKIDEKACLGCGVCVRDCPASAIKMHPRAEKVIPPRDSVHRSIMMAIEKGMLQHLIFDNKVLFSHRALAAVFGAILNLEPVKRAMASRQVKSRYLEKLLERVS